MWWVLKAALGAVLITSGAAKLANVPAFAAVIARLLGGRVRRRLAAFLAIAGSVAELTLGLISLALPWIGAANAAICVVLLCLLAVSLYGAVRHPNLSCQCFGPLDDARFGWRQALRDAVLFAASVAVLAQVPEGSASDAPWYGVLLVALGAGLFALAVAQSARSVQSIRTGAA